MAKNKKKPTVPQQAKPTPIASTSYSVLTAEAILTHYDVSFDQKTIAKQLKNQRNFYKILFKAPAAYIYNRYHLHSIEAIKTSSEEQLQKIHQIDSQTSPHLELSETKQQKLQGLIAEQQNIKEQTQHITQQHQQTVAKTDATVEEMLKKWTQEVEKTANDTIELLQAQGYPLKEGFRERLIDQLNKGGTDAHTYLSKAKLAQLGLPHDLSELAKIVVYLFIEDGGKDD
jgi:hypothetical protein